MENEAKDVFWIHTNAIFNSQCVEVVGSFLSIFMVGRSLHWIFIDSWWLFTLFFVLIAFNNVEQGRIFQFQDNLPKFDSFQR